MKNLLQQYFSISKKESTASISLGIIIIVFLSGAHFISNKVEQKPINKDLEAIANTALKVQDSINQIEFENYTPNKQSDHYAITPFKFDPNTIDEVHLNKLGLPKKFIKTFLNFRNKGAKFYKPEDFKKVWGLKEEDAKILLPYIEIEHQSFKTFEREKYNNGFQQKAIPAVIDINTATVYDFKNLPGVGNIAYKIVKYREKLGGFISINQVKETYDVTDSLFISIKPYLKIDKVLLNKININTATDFELSSHPYIEKNIAKAIVIYRTQHGNYKTVQDLKKIIFIKKELVDKIAPYLTTE